MFKKRTIKSTQAKRRSTEDELDTEIPVEIVEPSKRSKLSDKSASSSANNTRLADALKSPKKDAQKHEETHSNSHESGASPKASKVSGPKGAPKNVRVTTLTDFQPDVCKDFQQTGYCGYGDTCKFLHIRGESRAKKPVEKEWEIGKKDPESEEVPARCVICSADYKNPVKTLCGHVFCRGCFMDRFRAGKSKCVTCRRETGGTVQPTRVT